MSWGKLGKRQLEKLEGMAGVCKAQVVPDAITRSLCARGLMVALGDGNGGFVAITADGYRAIADAIDCGDITRPPLREWVRRP